MHFIVLKGLLIIPCLLISPNALGISGKLDFGESNAPSFRTQHDSRYSNPIKYTKTIKTVEVKPSNEDSFENIGVVCVSGGCNTTKSTAVSTDSIQTDVVVHVQTKVDLSQNNTKTVGDTPDVPVVVGYGSSKLDESVDEETNRALNEPKSIILTDLDSFSQPAFSSSFRPINPSIRTLDTSSVNTYLNSPLSSSVDRIDFSTRSNDFYPQRESDIDTPLSSVQSDGFYYQNGENIDRPLSSGFYSQKEPNININIKTLPAITVTVPETSRSSTVNNNQRTRGNEIHVPYFEPSYNTHYFGEHPPPQYFWYPKKEKNSFNPVEFKTVKPNWKPSVWNVRTLTNSNSHHGHLSTGNTNEECSCKKPQSLPRLGWSGSNRRMEDPGSQINDKLAPLN